METPYAHYYIIDADGITLVEFYEVRRDRFIPCNLEGEIWPRWEAPTIEDSERSN